MSQRLTVDLPAGLCEVFAPDAAASMIGRELRLDERIVGTAGPEGAPLLAADAGGLWVRGRVVAARIIDEGRYVRVEVEPVD